MRRRKVPVLSRYDTYERVSEAIAICPLAATEKAAIAIAERDRNCQSARRRVAPKAEYEPIREFWRSG